MNEWENLHSNAESHVVFGLAGTMLIGWYLATYQSEPIRNFIHWFEVAFPI